MFSGKQAARIREACEAGDMAALADVLCAPQQSLSHSGSLTVSKSLPYHDRGYHGDGTLLPTPPVKPPVVDGSVWRVTNQAVGDSDRAGENGFAMDVTGPARFDQIWALKWAKVTATGTTANGYHYANCVECGNGGGDDEANTPVRVFYQSSGDLPSADSIIPYIRDNNGLAYAVSGGGLPPGTTENDILRWNGSQWVIEPAPSTEGIWGLLIIDGVMQWIEYRTFVCGGQSS